MATILRKGYVRKAHTRKAYTKMTPYGTKIRIPATTVRRTVVPSHRIKDVGLPGKTPKSRKVLPKPTGILTKYGYSTKKSTINRRDALKKALKNKSYATLHRELVLLRTYTRNAQPANSKIYNSDIKFMNRNKINLKKLHKAKK